MPLNQIVFILTGALPVMMARLLFRVTDGLTLKVEVFSAASWEMMLVRAWEIQFLMLTGFSGLRPLARKVLYLASRSGPVTATFKGPLMSSCSARQYMRRKVGSL